MSDIEPIQFRRRDNTASSGPSNTQAQLPQAVTAFNRQELSAILNVYGRQVAAGEWRDYSIEFTRDSACFSVYRRTSEVPLYRIEKTPKLARKQGAYSVIAATGLILKRGQELAQVLSVFDKKMRVVGGH